MLYRLRAYNVKIPTHYQCIFLYLPPPIRIILQNGAGWPCIVIILFVQFLLPKTQIHFLLFEVHVCLLPLCGFPHHLKKKTFVLVLLGAVAGYLHINHQEIYLPPLLVSVLVPMLTQIQVSHLFWVPGMTVLPIKEASTIQALGTAVWIHVLQKIVHILSIHCKKWIQYR